MALFKRFFQPGRLAIGRFGDVFDKPVIIVDLLDTKTVIIDGPNVERTKININRLALTDYKLDISRGANSDELEKALAANDVISQWKHSSWGKKRLRYERLRGINDFDRFKLAKAKMAIANH